ncbi:DNA-binding transcriptional regulator, LysR family [Terrimicrobium sacchariphilum]|uniref:DNA-binding transcriptional regulator, LysR family n=1 Tax=Terrimicrobium sacchariphilum TaxID=690879 RepID=A0A146G5W8_TERSA|nr:LysR substrate-binding domain-containing protein [Terrimicrobium sacchariphilum]GAT32126.1 DNA-binding transcriptional regulator, LysR family [Terrimicrobium sacchariphilum]
MNRPTIRELECFTAVAEELNFSRAARRLNLSQPPLTRQIQSLEEKLGCPLLERSTRSVAITAAGRLFLEDARAVLQRLDAARDAVLRAAGGEVTRLRIGFVGALLDESLVRLLQTFREAHPHCQIALEDLSPAAQLEALSEGKIDGAFLGAPPHSLRRGLASFIWQREPLGIALPAAHPLAAARSLPIARLRDEGWIMVSREAAPAFRRQFDTLCAAEGFKPRIVQESERVAAVLTMVAAGQGISLLPVTMGRFLAQGVTIRPLPGRKPPTLDHTFVYKKASPAPPLADFVRLLGSPGKR